jgi:cobalt/nickel transport system permease protein
VVAAAIAGYGAINAAALLTAIEFGIQPLLFHDASGAPLYAPYPLSVAIPAMMLGHLTFAGFAELIVSGGVVAYLQKTDSALLSRTASGAAASATPAPAWASTRQLWAALVLLMILTPLGLLSVGSAWGEWAPQDFKSVAGRARIARASHGFAPPTAVPSGLHRLSTFWTAPIPDYAPPVMRNASFGYALSAMVGAGLVILVSLATGWATSRFARDPSGNGDE